VVFLDDRSNVLPRRSLRQLATDAATQSMSKEGVLAKPIDPRAIDAAASRDEADKPSDIATLGRAVGAEVVIYVTPTRFSLSSDNATFSPVAAARVKVIDTSKPTAEARVWPEEREGYELVVQTPTRTGDVPTSAASVAKAQDQLATILGDSVAKLFYKHLARTPMERAP
jgi:hypothetical protein